MSRNVPPGLALHLAQPATTVCRLLKIVPRAADVLGLTTLDHDFTYDDGQGARVYRAKRGYSAFDQDTRADLSVDSSQASALIAEYPLDGVTAEGVARGDYDGARFVQYLVNYQNPSDGHAVLNFGFVGQIKMIDDLACTIELRSVVQVLKQNSVIELTSITCRAKFGDERCKMPLIWRSAAPVNLVGAEPDRVFASDISGGFVEAVDQVVILAGDGVILTAQLKDLRGVDVTEGFTITEVRVDGVATTDYTVSTTGLVTFGTAPTGAVDWSGSIAIVPVTDYFVPGVVEWLTGANAGHESEVEAYDSLTGQFTLVIPTYELIQLGDTYRVRRDCDKSKAMCKSYNNLPNMRAEPELPRADGSDLQSPTKLG